MNGFDLFPENVIYNQILQIYMGMNNGANVVFKIKGDTMKEICFLNSIDSPYVVKSLGIGRLNSISGIMTEYANGGDLFDFLFNSYDPRRYDSDYLITIIYQIALGIRDIHRTGVFHRNIKPENIVLRKEGGEGEDVRAMIIDFEKAIRYDQHVFEYGTKQYCPPEMDQKTPLTMAADIYAFGVCILLILIPDIGRIPKFEDFETFMNQKSTAFPRLNPLKKILAGIFVDDPNNRITIDEIVAFELFDMMKPFMFDKTLREENIHVFYED